MAKLKTVAEIVREKIEATDSGYWVYADFSALPATAVSKALSRMSKDGMLERVSKGVYYRPRQTRFGKR
jgi:predicted transcriptional regulator of viral defense system